MFTTLPASAARAQRESRWTISSIAAHAAVVALAIAGTQRAREATRSDEDRHYVALTAPAPVRRQPAPTISAAAPGVHPQIPVPIPQLPQLTAVTFDPRSLGLTPSEIGTGIAPIRLLAQPSSDPLTAETVDQVVRARPDNPRPDYPPALRAARVEGDVLVRFIVDTAGRVEMASTVVLETTHPRFADAVRAWLVRTRYTPAQVRGAPVRQLVQQRIAFALR